MGPLGRVALLYFMKWGLSLRIVGSPVNILEIAFFASKNAQLAPSPNHSLLRLKRYLLLRNLNMLNVPARKKRIIVAEARKGEITNILTFCKASLL